VNFAARLGVSSLFAFTLVSSGCTEGTTPTSVNETPQKVISPTAPDEPQGGAPKTEAPAPETDAPKSAQAPAEHPGTSLTASPSTPVGEVALVPVKYDEMLAQIAANKKAKYTLVDAWATWCGPCKENFPHVVEMNAKYGDKGLAVISVSLDDPTNAKALDEAKRFLQEKNAVFTNFLLDEEEGVAFEKLNIMGIPAVFLFGPDGKELKRFTGDDPNNQFTYAQVDQAVAALLKD